MAQETMTPDERMKAAIELGKPEQVEAYSRRLIDEVGGAGGLILSSACTLPGAITAENFRAMLETGRTCELGGR